MSKRLTITYGDAVLYDETPEDFSWREHAGRVEIGAGAPAANPLGQALQTVMANNASKRVDRGKNGAATT